MAEFPEGADVVPNPVNRIAGFSVGTHYFLPGFPEMAWAMMEWALDTKHRALFRDRLPHEEAIIVSGRGRIGPARDHERGGEGLPGAQALEPAAVLPAAARASSSSRCAAIRRAFRVAMAFVRDGDRETGVRFHRPAREAGIRQYLTRRRDHGTARFRSRFAARKAAPAPATRCSTPCFRW